MIAQEVIAHARDIARTYGVGYYRATQFFPKKLREATWILYAFFRLPDQIVDEEHDAHKAAVQLDAWRAQWKELCEGNEVLHAHPILIAAKQIHDQYRIPFEYSQDFLRCMAQDLTVTRYESYNNLEDYMYGSAAVVGIMMSYVIGFTEGALPHAKALGDAMQLTNFLRDVDEDYQTRGRIYLPQEDMKIFDVTEYHIKDRIVDEKWKTLMQFEVTRARALFREGNKGISLLSSRGQKAVRVASALYEGILGEIEKQRYDVFTKRARTSKFTKIKLITKTLWSKKA